jgi:hypothetical protein
VQLFPAVLRQNRAWSSRACKGRWQCDAAKNHIQFGCANRFSCDQRRQMRGKMMLADSKAVLSNNAAAIPKSGDLR